MRGKVSKELRSVARKYTAGAPAVEYARDRRTGRIFILANCTRGLYKRIKRDYLHFHRNHQLLEG